jgi:putative peptide zinc metalloprotease protein
VTYVETRTNLWDGAPDEPLGPADPGLWGAVVDRIDPTRARPVLRAGIEAAELTSARGTTYVMLRSPDGGAGEACYLRLTPQEWQLALLMDGTHSVARLVAEFARQAGKLSPDQVRRVVADLAANDMLDELPDDAFRASPAEPGPRRARNGRLLLSFPVDRAVTLLYRAGGRFLYAKAAAIVLAVFALAGLGLFARSWALGNEPLFLAGDSYLLGAAVLLALGLLALVFHELGHALTAKRANREVSKAGIALSYGIPTLFVDTTDVYMSGRRARVLVTAAGPFAVLVLAGVAQLLGLAVPALAPIAFKLAFVCYLNVLLHLNPFLALDGNHLLMDWLEIPNLRGRAMAWLAGRLRGRQPGWRSLDREGKTIALYGILAVLWAVVAIVLAWRIVADRLTGLTTGLWPEGAAGRILLVAILVVLAAPFLVLGVRRLARLLHGLRLGAAERNRDDDAPRRLAALRNSELGGLPDHILTGLAGGARWLRPGTGTQIAVAGAVQQAVYVVLDGALEARKPGDPGGVIRHYVGAGGVVGLANALTGRASTLDWYTAGTTLLAVPTAAVASVIGPLPGPPPFDRAEAEALFSDTPALASLAGDERLALISSAHPLDLEPGAPVILPGPLHAVVIESGVIALPDGTELRRGTLIGPVGDGVPGTVAETRTPSRLWVIPDAADLPPLVGDPEHAVATAPGREEYPPLAAPPGPPDGSENYEVDRRLEKRMWALTAGVGIATLIVAGISFFPGPAWAEMPSDRALITADQGSLVIRGGGASSTVAGGGRRYVDKGDTVIVAAGSTGRLTLAGGGAVIFCGGSEAVLGAFGTDGGRVLTPRGAITLRSGRVLADTASTSSAYEPLALSVSGGTGEVTNMGAAWFAVDPQNTAVANGRVYVAGTPMMANVTSLSCGDGVPVTPPGGTPSESPSAEPSPSASLPSADPSASASASASAPATPTPTPDVITTGEANPVPDATNTAPTATRTTTVRPTRTTTPRPTNTRTSSSPPDTPPSSDDDDDPPPTSTSPDGPSSAPDETATASEVASASQEP